MGNLFNSIKIKKPGTNIFDLSHDVKLSIQMGRLVPTLALDVVPGDQFNIGCESMVRFSPMLAPIFHRVDVYMHYFFVPNRILWENWEEFITGANPAPAHPFIEVSRAAPNTFQWTKGSLHDYLGIPQPPAASNIIEEVNALPYAAYKCIYSEYYRDQNYITDALDPVTEPESFELTDGNNWGNEFKFGFLRLRAWEHDYFTSCLPAAQQGAAVDIPLAPFHDVPVAFDNNVVDAAQDTWTGVPSGTPSMYMNAGTPDSDEHFDAGISVPGELFAKTSRLSADPTTINDLRAAFRLQEWLEKTMRSGRRYTESILSHFGVKAQDMRLQRPEYITGTKSPVIISEVLNTTGDTGATDPLPQGNMSGHAISVTSGKYGYYSVKEHGWIMGIMSVMPKTAYQDGIDRKFFKTTYLDYYWPEFAHLGEQAVLNKEVYAFSTVGEETFGYNPRYSEMKFLNSRVAGDFRDNLDFWHMGRKFASPPVLDKTFIEMYHEDVDRVFAVQTADDALWCHVLHKIKAKRPMPKFGTPSF